MTGKTGKTETTEDSSRKAEAAFIRAALRAGRAIERNGGEEEAAATLLALARNAEADAEAEAFQTSFTKLPGMLGALAAGAEGKAIEAEGYYRIAVELDLEDQNKFRSIRDTAFEHALAARRTVPRR